MHRFFVPRSLAGVSRVVLEGELARQIGRVLRMRAGDTILLFDGTGDEYPTRLESFDKESIQAAVLSRQPGMGEPQHAVDLYLSLLNKPDKFEWALQKCTELGALRFVPVVAERSVTPTAEKGRRERWERIIKEAAEQSGRARLPDLEDAIPFREAVRQEAARLDSDGEVRHLALVPALGADVAVGDALWEYDDVGSVSLFIGPEGGFADEELGLADRRGLQLVSLGPRTLRAETAAVAALTVVMYYLGEMGGRGD